MSTRRELLALASGAAIGAATPAWDQAKPRHLGPTWVATWAAVPTTVPPTPPTVLSNQTVRHVVHVSIGGDELRIRLTNEFGEQPLHVGEVHVARRSGAGASIDAVAGTDRRGEVGGATRGAVNG